MRTSEWGICRELVMVILGPYEYRPEFILALHGVGDDVLL